MGKDDIYPELADYGVIQICGDEFIFLSKSSSEMKNITHYGEEIFEYRGYFYTGYGTMKSLVDLKHFPSLFYIWITLQPDIDWSTVTDDVVKQVKNIAIFQSKLTDIRFISRFENIIILSLDYNNIRDLSPLVANMKLVEVSFNYNQVYDLSSLIFC